MYLFMSICGFFAASPSPSDCVNLFSDCLHQAKGSLGFLGTTFATVHLGKKNEKNTNIEWGT